MSDDPEILTNDEAAAHLLALLHQPAPEPPRTHGDTLTPGFDVARRPRRQRHGEHIGTSQRSPASTGATVSNAGAAAERHRDQQVIP